MFNSVRYYTSQAFHNVFRNKLMVFISISTLMFCLLLLGLAIVFGVNLRYISSQLESQFELYAFVKLDYNEQQAIAVEPKIRQIDGIQTIKFATKEDALDSLKDMYDNSDAFSGLDEDNPLQYSYKITLTNIRDAGRVEQELKKVDGISDVVNRTDILNGITSFTSIAGNVSLIGMLVFAFIAVFIISNTIKLALMSRRREIEIMKSVGATNWFIRSPFIIEGVIVGFLGAVLSFIPTYFGYRAVLNWWTNFFGIFRFVPLSDISTGLLFVFLASGILIGSLGSVMSVRKYLRT